MYNWPMARRTRWILMLLGLAGLGLCVGLGWWAARSPWGARAAAWVISPTPTPLPTWTPLPTLTPPPTRQPPVRLDTATPAAPPTVSPQEANRLRLAMDPGGGVVIDPAWVALNNHANGLQIVEETLPGLTRINEQTAQLEPGIAQAWNVSPDGLVYTFFLRGDVAWVRWDAGRNQAFPVEDCNGQQRFLRAEDFRYGILRTLKADTRSEAASLLVNLIEGADLYRQGVVEEDYPRIKVLDDLTLEVRFTEPGSHYALLMGLAMVRAQPRWLIEGDDCHNAYPQQWTEAAYFQSYGPYLLKEWVPNTRITLIENPYWPGQDNIPKPRISQLEWTAMDGQAALAAYQRGEMDVVSVPPDAVAAVRADPELNAQVGSAPELCTTYLAFNSQAAVVKDRRVRRALSLAVDRPALTARFLDGLADPAFWFSTPGLVGAPASPEMFPDLGVRFDPQAAQDELAGYLREFALQPEGVDLTLTFPEGETQRKIAEGLAEQWQQVLGVRVKLDEKPLKDFRAAVAGVPAPQMWRGLHCYQYPDANDFIKEEFGIGGAVNPNFTGIQYYNPVFENALSQAARELDGLRRMEAFAAAEHVLVDEDAVVIPLFWHKRTMLTQPYVWRTLSVIGGLEHFEKWGFQ